MARQAARPIKPTTPATFLGTQPVPPPPAPAQPGQVAPPPPGPKPQQATAAAPQQQASLVAPGQVPQPAPQPAPPPGPFTGIQLPQLGAPPPPMPGLPPGAQTLAGQAAGEAGGAGPTPSGQQPGQQPPAPPPPGNHYASAQYLATYLDPRISIPQWEAWVAEGGYDPAGCPRERPFHSQRGNSGGQCVEKPVDCPDGMFLQGNNCVAGGAGVGGFPGTGGGGVGADWSSIFNLQRGPGGTQFGGPFQELFEGKLTDLLKGPMSRYSPEVVSSLLGQSRMQAELGAEAQTQAAMEDAARRGVFRSAVAGRPLAQIRQGAEAQVAGERANIMREKVSADYEDRNAALQHAQNYLDTLQRQSQFMTMTSEQRRQFNANLALAYARLSQEQEQFWADMQKQYDISAQGTGAGAVF